MVSADLSGMGNAFGHPVRWSIMVKICLFPEVYVSHSDKIDSYFIKWSICYFFHLQGDC